MALDGIFLRHIKKEIEQTALGARVSQIYQPNRDELVLILRGYEGSKKLLLSSRANSPRVNFCVKTPENPAQPPMFCMLLRKRLGGGKLVGVRQLGCDRVLFLDFECINELGDMEGLSIVCEIMGMYSNLIVINRDTGVIIDAIKRVDLTMSSRRFVLPNIKYELPDAQKKLNILEHTPEEVALAAAALPAEMPLSKALMQVIQGVSPIVTRELAFRVSEGATNRAEGVLRETCWRTSRRPPKAATRRRASSTARTADRWIFPLCPFGNTAATRLSRRPTAFRQRWMNSMRSATQESACASRATACKSC